MCCHQKFSSIIALKEHLTFNLYKPLKCQICEESIQGISEYISHLNLHTETQDTYESSQYARPRIYYSNEVKPTESFNLSKTYYDYNVQKNTLNFLNDEIKDSSHSNNNILKDSSLKNFYSNGKCIDDYSFCQLS